MLSSVLFLENETSPSAFLHKGINGGGKEGGIEREKEGRLEGQRQE
jgi:hypothetical protein